jgi:hypothetical protein
MELTLKRSTAEILAALQAGQLDIADVSVAEVVTIDKIDKSGDVPRLVETVTVTKVKDRDAEMTIVKH